MACVLTAISGLALAGCVGDLSSANRTAKGSSNYASKNTSTKPGVEIAGAESHVSDETKFSSRDFGVKGSPRVTTVKRPRKGGGRYQVGKPYKIKGRWYKPQLDENLKQVGLASWYGPNFHGRLTANGEIYDQFALTAAHPTMPLPSYATVTNLENGRRVTVRVNDRGPFAHNRVIDLSARAAKLLGYDRQGIAKVKVEYAGKAQMDGHDEHILMASYVGPNDTDTGAPTGNQSGSGTMLAMADTQPDEGPSEAISSTFENSQMAITSAGYPVGIPTARPTIFEGIPLDDGQPPVYRVKTITAAGPIPRNALSYVAGDKTDDSQSLEQRIEALKALSVSYLGTAPENEIILTLGRLDEPAVSAARLLVSDLSGISLGKDNGIIRLSVNEADANTALIRLQKAGLASAFVE